MKWTTTAALVLVLGLPAIALGQTAGSGTSGASRNVGTGSGTRSTPGNKSDNITKNRMDNLNGAQSTNQQNLTEDERKILEQQKELLRPDPRSKPR